MQNLLYCQIGRSSLTACTTQTFNSWGDYSVLKESSAYTESKENLSSTERSQFSAIQIFAGRGCAISTEKAPFFVWKQK